MYPTICVQYRAVATAAQAGSEKLEEIPMAKSVDIEDSKIL
jgi:hypothetical protein